MGLEGIVVKRADAPYASGRGHGWIKVKCRGREEFVVLGWTPPRGSRTGIGSLHLGYYDPNGGLHYAGGVGSGFSDAELARIRAKLDAIATDPPKDLLVAGDPLTGRSRWVRPKLIAEVEFTAFSGAGRVRHAVYLGLREDKEPKDVVRDPPDPDAAARTARSPRRGTGAPPRPASPRSPSRPEKAPSCPRARPRRAPEALGAVELTHPDRELWPGITKRDLAEYWRPSPITRCPASRAGHWPSCAARRDRGGAFLPEARPRPHRRPISATAEAAGSPYLAIDDLDGLFAMAQMSAIELHPGARRRLIRCTPTRS